MINLKRLKMYPCFFIQPTIGIDFVVTNVVRGGRQYRLQLWDTAGQERFKSLIPSYLKDSTCCLIVYDVGVPASAENVEHWVQLYSEHKDENAFVIVVGNKLDIKKYIWNKADFKIRRKKRSSSLLRVTSILKFRPKREKV